MGIPSLLMTVFCLLYEKMLNAGMGNKFEFDKEIIMITKNKHCSGMEKTLCSPQFFEPQEIQYEDWNHKHIPTN